MARRRELNAVAYDFLGFFISRNNDVGGYWAMGKLLKTLIRMDDESVVIDLLDLSSNMNTKEFDLAIRSYSNRFFNIAAKKDFFEGKIRSVRLEVRPFFNQPRMNSGRMAPHRMLCSLIIIDDLGTARVSARNAWCREHHPRMEIRSGRAEKV